MYQHHLHHRLRTFRIFRNFRNLHTLLLFAVSVAVVQNDAYQPLCWLNDFHRFWLSLQLNQIIFCILHYHKECNLGQEIAYQLRGYWPTSFYMI
jgi:hypothetical protein